MIIAAAQDTGGIEAAAPWYEQGGATFVTLVDTAHEISSLYNLVNVPSAVWIDETGYVRRIDEGAYATTHDLGGFEFGRADYAPMLEDWVNRGDKSPHASAQGELAVTARTDEEALAEPTFKLGVYFHQQGDEQKANAYWEKAQALNPKSWNYARQDWSFTPDIANENWNRKVQTLEGKPYYQPIEGLDTQE